MSLFSGIVSCHFSIASDLLSGARDVRVTIDQKSLPLSELLSRLWSTKHISESTINQHELLVFLTDKGGSPIFFKEKDCPELRAQALNVKTAMITNYSHIEITLLKISADERRERDVAEEEEELLKSIEQKSAENSSSSSRNNDNNNQQPQNQNQTNTTNNRPSNENEEFKRKAALLAKRLPLHYNLENLGDEITNDEERRASTCVLCNMPIRITKNPSAVSTSASSASSMRMNMMNPMTMGMKKPPSAMMMMGIGQRVKPAAQCPNPNSNGRCKKVCCDSCFEYAFTMKMMSMKCPICGGDKNTKKDDALALSSVGEDSKKSVSGSPLHSPKKTNNGAAGTNVKDDEDDELELLEQDPKKIRRLE